MIIFVGDKASKKNIKATIPFVGTKSYKTLLEWIAELKIDITEVILANREHVKVYGLHQFACVESPNMFSDINEDEDKIIALGEAASKHLTNLSIEHFKMDHPSGLNRKLNDKDYVKKKLKECRKYIND